MTEKRDYGGQMGGGSLVTVGNTSKCVSFHKQTKINGLCLFVSPSHRRSFISKHTHSRIR